MSTNYFPNLIGQHAAKDSLTEHLDCYATTRSIPHIMLTAPRGTGKTAFAHAIGRQLKDNTGKAKKFLKLNAAATKNMDHFWNTIIHHVSDRDVTVFFDEASALKEDVVMSLLTILEPNNQDRTSFTHDDQVVDFDFKRQTFLFATTEPQQVFHALMNRMDRIDLEDYTMDELADIIELSVKERDEIIKCDRDALKDIATVVRGNARTAVGYAKKITNYLSKRNKPNFTVEDWKKMMKVFHILPLGLNPTELKILKILSGCKFCSLTRLSSITALTKAALMNDYERGLLSMGLMEVGPEGRHITQQGSEYLKKL